MPARYAIDFVPANAHVPGSPSCSAPSVVSYSASPTALHVSSTNLSAISSATRASHASTDYSAISSVNFVVPNPPDHSANPLANSVTDYSVISSVNFATPPPVIVSSCIEPNT